MGAEVRTLKLSDKTPLEVKYYGQTYFGQWLGKDVDAPIYSFDAINWFTDQINYFVKNKFDQVTMITGDERSGKSALFFHIATILDENFPLSHITFTQTDVREKVRKISDESVIAMDEAGAAMFAQEWMERGQRELVKAFQVFGMKRLKFFITLPHKELLNNRLRNRRTHWWIDVYTKGVRRGYAELRRAVHSKWQTRVFWEPVFAFTFPKYTGDLWGEYEKRKAIFIDEQLAGKHSGGKDTPTDSTKRMHRAAKTLHREGKDAKEIGRLLGYSRQHVYDIIKRKDEATEPSSQ